MTKKYDDLRDGPAYPALAILAASRRKAVEGGYAEKCEHGRRVLAEIDRMNRQSLQREVSMPQPRCESDTFSSDGLEILAAIDRKNKAQMEADCRAEQTRKVNEGYFEKAYAKAMEEKRKRISHDSGPSHDSHP